MTARPLLPIVLLLLAACSGDDSAATEPSAPATTEATATASTSPPTSAGSSETTAPTAPAGTAPPTTEPGPPFMPVADGEYEVGVTTVTLDDPDRPLTVDIWFPLADGTDGLPPHQYTLLPGVYYASPDAFSADAGQLAEGTFPLVIYSHGSGGLRYIHSALTEAIAGHGYIVAAADHTGNTAIDTLAAGGADRPDDTTEPTEEERRRWEEIGLLRADDVDRLIDAMTDPDGVAGPFAAEVDPDRISVAGHSAGGATAIAMTIGIASDLGTFPPDDRVDAVVLLAPALGGFTDDELAAVDVPAMAIVGTADSITPPAPNTTRLWSLSDQSPAYDIELTDAEHYAFTNICAYQAAVPTLADVPRPVIDLIDSYAEFGCAEGNMAPERTEELTDTYVIAFLDEVLRDGPSVVDATGTPPDDVARFDAR